MNNINGLEIKIDEQNKMDEKLKRTNTPVCNQKLCANVNFTSSQPRGLC
jgi:hypothetical protein